MVPISVRVDFNIHGMMYPVYYNIEGVYVRVDRILSFGTNGQEYIYTCRCQDRTSTLRFAQSKWFLMSPEKETDHLLFRN